MWKQALNRGFKYDQPNAAARKLILSVLSSTATRREARDYLVKYGQNSPRANHCLLLIRHLQTIGRGTLWQLSGAIEKLRMLGIRPIFVIPPSGHVMQNAETLDKVLTTANLRPIHLQDGLFRGSDGTYSSILSSQASLFDSKSLDLIPVIQPYVFDEATASQRLTTDMVCFMENIVPRGGAPYIDKFFILNNIGGIPSDERRNNAHVFINLSQEYKTLASSLGEKAGSFSVREPQSQNLLDRLTLHLKEDELISLERQYKEHLEDLQLMNAVLSRQSNSSTGLITTTKAAALASDRKNPLLYNLLTDRSLISSSLPRFKARPEQWDEDHSWYEMSNEVEANDYAFRDPDYSGAAKHQEDSILVTTVLKRGVHIKTLEYRTLSQYNSIGLPKSFHSKEASKVSYNEDSRVNLIKLKRILDNSFGRDLDLDHYLNRINGRIASIIVIGDYEGIAVLTYEGPSENPFVYLDKFAVLPHLKGSLGISDIIFNLMFKSFPRELLWRSRSDNVVNKWYFQRSVGVLDLSIALSDDDRKKSQFKLFYHGDPDSNKDPFQDKARLKEYAIYVRDIEPSWAK